MQNPLFESLLKKVKTYENPQMSEQTTPPKGTVFSDFVKSLAQIGTKLVDQYIAAIKSYPDTKIKKEYEKGLPDKLAAILASVDKTKTVGIQVDSLFKAVKAEATAFFKLGEGDTEVVKFLKPWRESFRAGFNAYQQAVNSAMEYVKKQEDANTAKMSDAEYEMISKAVSASIDGYNKSTQVESTLKDDWGSNESYSYKSVSVEMNESSPVLNQLISNKICVDFNTYNKIINEAKEDRVARRAAKASIINGENLGAQIDAVLSVIGSRLSDPAKAKFKSLAMKDQFMSIATNLSQIQTELAIDDKELKDVNFGEIDKQIKNLETLFADKKKSFEETYADEEKNSRSFKTLEVATPEVTKFLSDGDVQFGQLSILAQKAANMAAEEAKKPKPATGTSGTSGTAGSAGSAGASVGGFTIKEPIKKGTKSDDVKKFQELVVNNLKDLKGKAPWFDSLVGASKQFGNFGGKTEDAVKGLKQGFELKDTSSDITQELIDKIATHNGKINDSRSFLYEDFNLKAANAAVGGGSSSSTRSSSSGGSSSKSSGTETKSTVFACIKKTESKLIIKGKEATITRDNGSIHTFNADGTYKFYYITKKKTQEGTWKCTADSYEAYTEEDKDTYYGSLKDWKSNIDNAEKAKAEEAKKAAESLSAQAGEICKEILVHCAGDTEEEQEIMEIFQKKITTAAMFDAVQKFWDNKWWPSTAQLRNSKFYFKNKSVEEITKGMNYKNGKTGQSLRMTIKNYFNDAQIARLNQYLPSGVKAI
jgi:hypothetical protein